MLNHHFHQDVSPLPSCQGFSCAVASCELKDQVPLWRKALGLLEAMALTQVEMNILTLRGVLMMAHAGNRAEVASMELQNNSKYS